MKILILGAGKMGSFFIDLLSFDHEVAVYERDPRRLRFTYNCQRFSSLDEIDTFNPELVINAVTVRYTMSAFDEVIPHLPESCILSDISSVKTGLKEYYEKTGFRYVSTHPMFGPTFANLNQLSEENAIIISEGDYMGAVSSVTFTAVWDLTYTSTPSTGTTVPWHTPSPYPSYPHSHLRPSWSIRTLQEQHSSGTCA